MDVPKSVVKFSKNGITYTSSVDKSKYLLKELIRAALRDVGKYICRNFRRDFYSQFKRRTRRVGKYTQYWVRTKQEIPDLQVGLKPNGFYGGFQENGSRKTPKLGLLANAARNNIATIVQIMSQYLSSMEDEAAALSKINENDYEGSAEE